MKYPEELIQVLWKCRLYANTDIQCVGGEQVRILSPGIYNRDAGPDFLHAKLRINNLLWVGHVEIHWDAKSWFAHRHQDDLRYDNVILHVVWENECEIRRKDGSIIPTLQLKNYVSTDVLKQHHVLQQSRSWIPCADQLKDVPLLVKLQMLDRMAKSRLEAKAAEIAQLLVHYRNDWEKVTQQLFAESFGMRVNKHAFSQLIASLPANILDRYQGKQKEIEALLFGQAGLLSQDPPDSYAAKLSDQYVYLQQLYQLTPMSSQEWRFLRMRPANFPTVRIAQLASFFSEMTRICQLIVSIEDLRALQQHFSGISTSAYWLTHNNFGKSIKKRAVRITSTFLDHIAINCFVPILYAYGHRHGDELMQMRAVDWLNQIPLEQNTITSHFLKIGLSAQHAADSQALIQLHRAYCEPKQCLSCAIGIHLLSRPRS